VLVGKNWNRREFLKAASATTLGMLSAGFARQFIPTHEISPGSNASSTSSGKAKSVILIWLAGGVAHAETFDPKRHTPFKRYGWQDSIISTFPTIDTNVDNIKFSSGLENIAKVIDRGTVLRSFKPSELGHILHSRHQYNFHVGYPPPQPIPMAHFGSIIARTLGPINPDIPPFVHIGQRLDIAGVDEVRAYLTSGFLGAEYAPMLIADPQQAVKAIYPPEEMTPSRFANRQEYYKRLVAQTPIGEFGSDFQQESLLRSMDNAYRLVQSKSAKAFDISLEPKESYDKYNTGRFGLGCLLARRLVEEGVRFVEVSSEFVPFGNWDTHDSGHQRTVKLKQWIDRPISQLVLDLEELGLLDSTLVIVASEFTRAGFEKGNNLHVINANHYGLHYHNSEVGSILMFGGGTKKGFVYGATADDRLPIISENPVSMKDLHASFYHAVGISPDTSYEFEKRPVYVTDNGEGKPVTALFA